MILIGIVTSNHSFKNNERANAFFGGRHYLGERGTDL